MQSTYRWAGLGLFLVLGLPAFAVDKKDGDKKDADPKDKAAEKMVTGGQVSGTLKTEGGSQKYITLTVSLRYAQPNPQAALNQLRQQQQMMQYQQQIMRAPPWQRQQLLVQMMNQMRQGQASAVQIKQVNQDIDFQAADDMKVRTMFPPPGFDEKGNVKRYTAKELKELKGDGNLPGYAAEMDALKPGQTVTVYLAKQKPKEKGKDKDKDALEDDKPPIKMIVIVAEPLQKG